jgi:hypothetical protein
MTEDLSGLLVHHRDDHNQRGQTVRVGDARPRSTPPTAGELRAADNLLDGGLDPRLSEPTAAR